MPDTHHEEQPPTGADVPMNRKERRAAGKHPQTQVVVQPTKGKGAALPPRRQYSNRRSG